MESGMVAPSDSASLTESVGGLHPGYNTVLLLVATNRLASRLRDFCSTKTMDILLSQINDIFLMLGDLVTFVPSPLILVPVTFLISLFYWRHWKLLLHVLFLLWLSVVVMSISQRGMNLIDTVYASLSSILPE